MIDVSQQDLSQRGDPSQADSEELTGSARQLVPPPGLGLSNKIVPVTTDDANGTPKPPTVRRTPSAKAVAKLHRATPKTESIDLAQRIVLMKQNVFGIGRGVLGMPDSKMIHPDSPFARVMTVRLVGCRV